MASVVAGLVFLVACDESLPPRIEPEQFLIPSLSVENGPVILDGGVVVGPGGSLRAALRNTYNEVLQSEARAEVVFEVRLAQRPEKKATVVFGAGNIVTDRVIIGSLATLGVDSSVVFFGQWSHATDDGEFFHRFVNSETLVDSRGRPYRRSEPVEFLADASIQLFRGVPAERIKNIRFSLVYHVYDDTTVLPPI